MKIWKGHMGPVITKLIISGAKSTKKRLMKSETCRCQKMHQLLGGQAIIPP